MFSFMFIKSILKQTKSIVNLTIYIPRNYNEFYIDIW